MVFNLAIIIQVMLVGKWRGIKAGLDAQVSSLFRPSPGRSAHNDSYLRNRTEALTDKQALSFVEVMWMLKER